MSVDGEDPDEDGLYIRRVITKVLLAVHSALQITYVSRLNPLFSGLESRTSGLTGVSRKPHFT
jgi:hypothetical protein